MNGIENNDTKSDPVVHITCGHCQVYKIMGAIKTQLSIISDMDEDDMEEARGRTKAIMAMISAIEE